MNIRTCILQKIRSRTQSNVIQNFFIYSFGALCLGGFTILLAPINMRLLSPHDYGVLALINSCITVGVSILGLGLRQLLSIEYFHHDAAGQKKLINQILFVYACTALPLCLILLALQSPIIHWFSLHQISPDVFTITVITIFFYFFAELLYQILKYRQRALLLTTIQISIALGSLALTVTLLLYCNLGFMSSLIGQCASMCAATGVGIYLYRKEKFSEALQLKPHRATIAHFLKQSFPFIPGILCGWVIASSDRWLLAHYTGMHEVGIYAIADMFGAMFRLLILQSWSGSYLPYILMRYQNNKDELLDIEKQNLTIMWIAITGLMLIIILGFWLAQPLILIILPVAYHESLHYILIILAGHIFLLGSYFAASFIQFHKKTYFLAASFCIPAILNVAFNILLIPHYQIYGCTGATLISYALYFGIMLGYNKHLQNLLQH